MANNIGAISGGGTGGVYWNNRPANNSDVDENKAQDQTQNANQERKDVNPDDVMRFLANNNYFMPVQTESAAPAAGVGEVDAATEERIAGYMERFEEIYAIVEQEFGPESAPTVMDFVMDKLMGMA